ncbi:MAG: hypothetical protein KatS3mg031_1007 [Chitinophagales bacterium]|nr:MAG: hypothetical protein KatS3mg031_1007 [Chitinophagales bacterium]
MILIRNKKYIILLTTVILGLFPIMQATPQTVPIIEVHELQDYLHPKDDSIHVINFWATWCKPCVEELPHFEKLNSQYKKQGVNVMLVSLDFKSQYATKVLPFVENHHLRSKVVLLDTKGKNDFIDQINPQWSGTIPATLITQKGKPAIFLEKQLTYQDLESIIKPLIINP